MSLRCRRCFPIVQSPTNHMHCTAKHQPKFLRHLAWVPQATNCLVCFFSSPRLQQIYLNQSVQFLSPISQNSISHHSRQIGIFERGDEIENMKLEKNLFSEHSHTEVFTRIHFLYLVFCQGLRYCCDRDNIAVCVLISYSLLYKTLGYSGCTYGGTQVDCANVPVLTQKKGGIKIGQHGCSPFKNVLRLPV